MKEIVHISVTPTRMSKLVTIYTEDGLVSVSMNLTEVSRNRLIAAVIRSKYSVDDMEAVVNNFISEPESEKTTKDFKDMNDWRKLAKRVATAAMEVMKESGLIEFEEGEGDA